MSIFKRLGTIDAIVAKLEPPRQFGTWPKPYSKQTYASLKTNPEIVPPAFRLASNRRHARSLG